MFRIVRSLGAGGRSSQTGVWHLRVERARQGRSRVSERDCPERVERPALRALSEGPAGESRLEAALTAAVGASGAMPSSMWMNKLGLGGIGRLRQSLRATTS